MGRTLKLLGPYPGGVSCRRMVALTGKRRGQRAGRGGQQVPELRKSPQTWGGVCVSGFAEVRGRREFILKNKLQCIPECQVVTGGILWFYVSHRRVKD